MQTVNIHEAKTHLSRLVEQAANGEPFIIAKAGKPMVKVMALETEPPPEIRRLGALEQEFREGKIRIPDDFNTMFQDEIEKMFHGEDV